MNLVIGCDSLLIEQSQRITEQVSIDQPIIPGIKQGSNEDSSQYALLYEGVLPVATAHLIFREGCVRLIRLDIIDKYRVEENICFLFDNLIKYARRQGARQLDIDANNNLKTLFQHIGFVQVEQSDGKSRGGFCQMRFWLKQQESCASS